MTCPEKKMEMKKDRCAQEAAHIHFGFWHNSRYAQKNSSYTKVGNSNTYERFRLDILTPTNRQYVMTSDL